MIKITQNNQTKLTQEIINISKNHISIDKIENSLHLNVLLSSCLIWSLLRQESAHEAWIWPRTCPIQFLVIDLLTMTLEVQQPNNRPDFLASENVFLRISSYSPLGSCACLIFIANDAVANLPHNLGGSRINPFSANYLPIVLDNQPKTLIMNRFQPSQVRTKEVRGQPCGGHRNTGSIKPVR